MKYEIDYILLLILFIAYMRRVFSILVISISLSHPFGFGNTAVSELNYKVSSTYGNYNGTESYFIDGSAAVPLGESYGIQIDSSYQKTDSHEFKGLGGQFFWRDYKKGLLGINGGIIHDDALKSYGASCLGEYYLKNLTFGSTAGWNQIRYKKPVSFESSSQSGFLGGLYCIYYPIDDLSFTLTAQTKHDIKSIQYDLEYALPANGVSVFASVQNAEEDYEHAYLGLRYYFGSSSSKKTLKERHRWDDPINILQGILNGVFHRGVQRNRKGKETYGDDWQQSLGCETAIIGGDFPLVVGPEDSLGN